MHTLCDAGPDRGLNDEIDAAMKTGEGRDANISVVG